MKILINNRTIEVEKDSKIIDILKDDILSTGKEIIACRYNNEVRTLNYPLNMDGTIEFIDTSDSDGRLIYIRGLLFIMSKAFSELYPEALLTVNYQLTNAMYCEVDNMEITDEIITNISIRMQEIIKRDLPIEKVCLSKEEAEKFFKSKNTLRGKLQIDSKSKETVSLYYCEEYFNYFFGAMPISTGFAKVYDLKKYKGGFLVRYPSKIKPNELNPYKETLKLLSAMQEYDDTCKLLEIDTVYKLNKKIRENKARECILLSEALHDKKMVDLIHRINEKNDVKLILIAGPSSSGKTTFANKLGIGLKLSGHKPVMISVDNYFVEREQNPRDEFGNYDFECLEAIDLKLFNDHLLKLLNGQEIEMPEFDFTTGCKKYTGKKLKLSEDEILVIEGIHCLNDKLTEAIDKKNKFKIYISDLTVLNIDYYNRVSTTDTRLIRRIVRDKQFRNYTALHTLKMWYSVNRGEEKNIFPYQEEADYMFNSSLVYEISVLKKYVVPLLNEIDNTHREYSEAKRLLVLLDYFETIDIEEVPNTSLLREFTGGSIFEK